MTRYDCIRNLTKDQMAEWLCDVMEETSGEDMCDNCPASYMCKIGHRGWLEYLEKDPGTGKRIWNDMDSCIEQFFDYSDKTIAKAKGETNGKKGEI